MCVCVLDRVRCCADGGGGGGDVDYDDGGVSNANTVMQLEAHLRMRCLVSDETLCT